MCVHVCVWKRRRETCKAGCLRGTRGAFYDRQPPPHLTLMYDHKKTRWRLPDNKHTNTAAAAAESLLAQQKLATVCLFLSLLVCFFFLGLEDYSET